MELGKYNSALKDFEQKEIPEELLTDRGRCYLELGKYNLALQYTEKAIKINNKNPQALFNLARIKQALLKDDATAKELVYIICNSDNVKRRSEAVQTLIAILPSLDANSVDRVIKEMMYVVANSDNEARRAHARQILIPFKLLRGPQ